MATYEYTVSNCSSNAFSAVDVGAVGLWYGSKTISGIRAKLSSGTGTFNLTVGPTDLAVIDDSDLPGDVLWHLRAEDLGAPAGASDGDAVEWWYSFNKGMTIFRQSTAGGRPLYKTALGPGDDTETVLFDGTDDRMPRRDGTYIMAAADSFTMFFVIGDLSSTSPAPLVGTWDTGAGSREALWGTISSRQFWQNDDGEYKRTSADVAADQIRSITFNGPDEESTEHIDGAATFTDDGSVSKDFSFTWDTIAGSAYTSSSDYLDGAISEVILFEGALGTDEREIVEGYLAHKWGWKALSMQGIPTNPPIRTVPRMR